MGHIQRRHLTEAKALVPPAKLLEAMNQHFAPLINKLVANRVKSRTLADLRDALLPKLISGELRVKEGEGIERKVS
jgi:type I restriction enzyme, S subunit